MDLNLKDKVIIVTGGASGIGESIVRKLADEDAIACIVDRNEEMTLRLSNELKTKNKNTFFVVADLTKNDLCKDAIDKVLNKFGRIDGLVNNAGLNDGVGLENGSADSFIQSLKINVGHYYSMAHFAFNSLCSSKGNIVNICSKVAETGQGNTSGYAAANGIRFELTTAWAHELLSFGIRVNAVIVSECFTPQYKWWISKQANPEEALDAINSKIPFEKRMTTPGEIADTVLFLLSSKSGTVNGELFHVDGGYVHLDRRL
ncbi:MAG: SDR family oxidoreductase [Parafilimonas sp.]